MRNLWNNEWFKLGYTVALFLLTAVDPAWGGALMFAYFVAWVSLKQ